MRAAAARGDHRGRRRSSTNPGGHAMRTTRAPLAGAVLLAATAAGTASALLAHPARGTPRGPNGAIVYQARAGAHARLSPVAREGGGPRQLTHDTKSDAVHAAWSPDG